MSVFFKDCIASHKYEITAAGEQCHQKLISDGTMSEAEQSKNTRGKRAGYLGTNGFFLNGFILWVFF